MSCCIYKASNVLRFLNITDWFSPVQWCHGDRLTDEIIEDLFMFFCVEILEEFSRPQLFSVLQWPFCLTSASLIEYFPFTAWKCTFLKSYLLPSWIKSIYFYFYPVITLIFSNPPPDTVLCFFLFRLVFIPLKLFRHLKRFRFELWPLFSSNNTDVHVSCVCLTLHLLTPSC